MRLNSVGDLLPDFGKRDVALYFQFTDGFFLFPFGTDRMIGCMFGTPAVKTLLW